MELAPHQQRVIGEKRELDDRLGKLVAFIDSAIFDGLDAEEQDRLRRQAACMADLSQILGERIAAFGEVKGQENA